MATNVKFGIEVECFMPKNAPSVAGFEEHGDGSLSSIPGWKSCEYVSRPESDIVRLVCGVQDIADKGGRADTSCGGHIHVSCDEMQDVSEMLRMASRIEKFMDNHRALLYQREAVGRDRCRYNNDKSITDRYRMVNIFRAYDRHGTFEFRFFSGSVDPQRWGDNLMLVNRIIRWAASDEGMPWIMSMWALRAWAGASNAFFTQPVYPAIKPIFPTNVPFSSDDDDEDEPWEADNRAHRANARRMRYRAVDLDPAIVAFWRAARPDPHGASYGRVRRIVATMQNPTFCMVGEHAVLSGKNSGMPWVIAAHGGTFIF